MSTKKNIDELIIPDWEEILKHCKICMPSENTEFKVNIAGLNFRELAWVLRYLAVCIDAGVAGNKTVVFEGEMPFVHADVTWHGKFSWEDDFDECDMSSGALILSRTFDGTNTEIDLHPRLCEAGDTDITKWLTHSF